MTADRVTIVPPRHVELIHKRATQGLSPEELAELIQIQAAQRQASDLTHDLATEARRYPPDRINFHE